MALHSVQDGYQNFSQLFAQGTLGTADVGGTAGAVSGAANPATGAQYVHILAGTVTVGGGGTQAVSGTVSTNQLSGTQNVGTVNSSTINTGTINNATVNASTINTGTINSATVNAGTFTANGGTIGILQGGTVSVNMLSGTLNLGTIVNNGGSVAVTAGTINSGTMNAGTINTGTINSATINLGTVVGKDAIGAATTAFPVFVGGNNNGTVRSFNMDTSGNAGVNQQSGTQNVGTVNSSTINTGTINAATINTGTINSATVNAGTINAGTTTLNAYPAQQVVSNGAVGTAAAGTLVAAPAAGVGVYVNSFNFTAMSGTLDMCLSFGTQLSGNQVIARGLFAPGGGIALGVTNPSYYGTAAAPLTFQIVSGAGSASWSVTTNNKGTP